MTNTNNERGLDNIRRGLGNADQARRDRIERADRRQAEGRATFGADPATLSELLEVNPELYGDLSNAQRIGLGLFERGLDRDNTEGDEQ